MTPDNRLVALVLFYAKCFGNGQMRNDRIDRQLRLAIAENT